MGEISLEMIWKRLEDLHTGQEAIRSDLAELRDTVRSFAKTNLSMQREISRLNDRVAILTAAIDDHPPDHRPT
jgi:septal ring factor EnvC (AmiA/AmiB activator)